MQVDFKLAGNIIYPSCCYPALAEEEEEESESLKTVRAVRSLDSFVDARRNPAAQ